MKKKHLSLNIFDKNINNKFKIIPFNIKKGDVGEIKYLPPYFKEWNNTVFSYNKNNLKNISVSNLTINKIIKSYFNLFFINYKHISPKIRRTFLKSIYVSKPEIKHNNSTAIITLYTVNLRKFIFVRYLNLFYYYSMIKEWEKVWDNKWIWVRKKPFSMVDFLRKNFLKFIGIETIYLENNTGLTLKENNLKRTSNIENLRNAINLRFKLLNKGINSYNLYRKIFLIKEIKHIYYQYLMLLYKYNYQYLFNNIKFQENNISFITKLKSKLSIILNKKIELNIINLKSIVYNSDLFTKALSAKLKKRRLNVIKSMITIINKGKILPKYKVFEMKRIKNSELLENKYKDLSLISLIKKNNLSILLKDIYPTNKFINLSLYENYTEIYNTIFDLIKYKNMGGIRLEVKGRLTKRYRADRAIYKLFWKGGLKNIDSSYRRISSVMFRGHLNSNVTYSISKSKRRIGSFAVKGWISGR